MADVKVTWQVQITSFPEGTKAPAQFIVRLGTLTATVPLGTLEATFINVGPGDYPSAVDVVAADATVLGTAPGNVVHVPAPVMVPSPMNVVAVLV